MKSFVHTVLLLLRVYVLRVLFTKRSAIVLLGCAVPPTIASIVLTVDQKTPPAPIEVFLFPSFMLVLQLMVPLASVIAGSAVVADEVDDRTITYLLTRPIPRAAILIGRWLATLIIVGTFAAASVFALRWVVENLAPLDAPPIEPDATLRRTQELVEAMRDGHVPAELFRGVLAMALLGVAVYSAVFAVLGTFLKYPMIVGLGYTFAIEGFLANLPGKSQALTIQYYLRSYLFATSNLWNRLPEINEMSTVKFASASESVITLGVVLVVALTVGCLTISRRQYVLTA